MGGYGYQRLPRRIPRNVEVIGHVPADSMDLLVWHRTLVLLAPSRRESWGMTATEALQRGIPVIAHPASGLLESLASSGWFIDRDDVAGWMRAIRLLSTDPSAYQSASVAAARRGRELLATSCSQLEAFVSSIESLVPNV
jgi:glycosyltransferase involved in cell wall biosynthesis